MKRLQIVLPLVLVVLAGCAGTRNVATTPVDVGVETVAFATEAEQVAVLDEATAVLIAHDFTITLANERLGLLQTDYASVATVEALRPDTTDAHPALDNLYMRLTVNTVDRNGVRHVQLKGNFQRLAGGSAPDRLIGLYWMERLAGDMAAGLDADYVDRVSSETYDQALANAVLPGQKPPRSEQMNRGLRAVGIVSAVLFAATLAAGVLAPSGSR